MTLGREAAGGLWQAASTGQFKLDKDAAHELAGHYQWIAEQMAKQQDEIANLQVLRGFGGFDSAKQLQEGFGGKAVQAFQALKAAEESAYKMKAAILQAAGLSGEVEAANTAAIKAAGKAIPDANV
ncbi:hypothetical protein IU500_09370 [Nocardia terpenica]|uniref:hypothetical protein n=1 Tax=Nocardia terpenica TaxID=455432 RepID=UPI001892F82E|nr:hypothetical protein [Nocardia terpenica]MBF6062162.1 hypothetical protein [Nocardia terpenica]MBF6104250.1 hypothetical protein [Nocardia terpenica]MBF6109894.1 hypothetical protein [Nocardia terpenica]MBF6120200.1 hypothetical protein [Nocardia terpenica]MBF6152611.1 hypothetical protein [Nocardia terpenica]